MRSVVLAGLLALSVSACGGGGSDSEDESRSEVESAAGEASSSATAPSPLEAVYEPCAVTLGESMLLEFGAGSAQPAKEVFFLEDDGSTILINPPEGSLASPFIYEAVVCVLDATSAPAVVEQRLGATTPMSGRQSESWDGITFDWSTTDDGFGPDLTASFVFEG